MTRPQAPTGTPPWPSASRGLTGKERAAFIAGLVARYNDGESVAAIATSLNRSNALARDLLLEGGVTFRPPGRPAGPRCPACGSRMKPAAAAAPGSAGAE